jgi:hypothetical protein
LDSQQTMTDTLQQTSLTTKKLKNMQKEQVIHHKINDEVLEFKKTADELYLLKCVSNDLKNYRKMIRIKKYD